MKKKAAAPKGKKPSTVAPIATVPPVAVAEAPKTPVTKTAAEAAAELERPHHPYSPSSLQNLEACPCYKSRQTQHARTIAGTLAHKMVETQQDDENLSDEDALAAADCLDFLESRRRLFLDEAKQAWVAAGSVKTDIPKFDIEEHQEIYLPIDDCKFDDCVSTSAGYVDHVFISWNKTRAEMMDWKFGFWAVEKPETNLQGITYSLGLFKKFPALREIRFWFKQPHIDFLDSALFTREQIPALYLRVQTVVARARLARKAGDYSLAKQYVPVCNFCERLGDCPLNLATMLQVAHKFAPLEFPEDITPSKILDPHSTLLALNLASVAKVWSEAFRRQVTDRVLRRDAPVPDGYGITEMPGRREVANMTKFREIALKHVPLVVYEQGLKATFGPLEEFVNDNAPRGTKKAAVEAFQEELVNGGAVVRGPGFSFLKILNSKEKK